MIEPALAYVLGEHILVKRAGRARAADQGCGKLRHLAILRRNFARVLLIETLDQLNRPQKIFGDIATSIPRYVRDHYGARGAISFMAAESFARSSVGLDLILNACVLDVVPPNARQAILKAAARNLRAGGLLVLIVPRNDQSILVRCTRKNRFFDGYVFRRGSIVTFYRNFDDAQILIRIARSLDLDLVQDLSIYRQVCLIFSKRVPKS